MAVTALEMRAGLVYLGRYLPAPARYVPCVLLYAVCDCLPCAYYPTTVYTWVNRQFLVEYGYSVCRLRCESRGIQSVSIPFGSVRSLSLR